MTRSTPTPAAAPRSIHPDQPCEPVAWPALLALAIASMALLRCVVPISPEIYWDVDPRSTMHGVVTTLGPTGAAALDVLGTLLSAVALACCGRVGRPMRWAAWALATGGAMAALWHLPRHGAGMITLGAWVSGVMMALAMVHLAGHPQARRWVVAMLGGVIVVWLLRAMAFVFWEHAHTVENYLATEAQFLAARGWAEGSPQHLLFRRRLMYPDVTGVLGLSNIFGSLVAAMTAIMLALAARAGWLRHGPRALGLGGLAVLAGVVLYYTHARGAMVALVMAVGLLGLAALAWRWRGLRGLMAPALMVALAMPAALVLARAAQGPPETESGERSLLFRAHYWEASARMLAEGSWQDRLMGVGVGPFKDAYTFHKNPLNPEEVTSAHGTFVDWVAMLGVGGGLWCVLLVIWLWQAGRGLAVMGDEQAMDDSWAGQRWPWPGDRDMKIALGFGLWLLGLSFYVQKEIMLDPVQWLIGAASVGGFAAVMATLMHPGWMTAAMARGALALGAAVLMIHGQIEMVFFNFQAMPLAMVMLAAAAAPAWPDETHAAIAAEPPRSASRWRRDLRWAMPASAGALALALVTSCWWPVARQQLALASAAHALADGRMDDALRGLDQAIERLPRDPRPYDSKAMLLIEIAAHQQVAGQAPKAIATLTQGLRTLDQARDVGLTDLNLLRRRAQMLELAARWSNDPSRFAEAVAAWLDVLRRAPYALSDTLHLADGLWAARQPGRARPMYERVLELDRQSYLDSARQLTAVQRQRVHDRLAEQAAVSP